MDVILFNAVLYCLTSLVLYNKCKRVNIFVLYWMMLAFLSVMSVCTIKIGAYLYNPDPEIGYKLSCVPYFFNYVANWIISWPLYSVDETQIRYDSQTNSKAYKGIILFSILLTIAFTVLKFSEAIVVSSIGYNEVYEALHNEGKSLFVYTNPILIHLNNQGGLFVSMVQPFIILYFFDRLKRKKGSKYLNMCGMLLPFLPKVCLALANASKGMFFFIGVSALFYFIIFSPFLTKQVKRIIVHVMALSLVFFVVFVMTIQASRVGGDVSIAFDSSVRYLGEPMLNLGDDVYDHVKEHPYGARLFPELFGIPGFKSEGDRFYYWTKITGITEAKFTTFWGDCYVEFGLLGGTLFLFFFVLLWKIFVFSKYKKIHMFPLVYFYFSSVCISGIFDYNFYTLWSKLMILLNIALCVYMGSILKRKAT